jgi:photosynthetic reaction center H subunit
MSVANSSIDFALVAIISFFIFFVGLVIYLRREDRREGYPVEEDGSGRLRTAGGVLFMAPPKTFHLSFGRGDVTVPNARRDRRPVAGERTSVTPGSPMRPMGDPMVDGVGPAAYAERAKVPDLDLHGQPKIVPMRAAAGFTVADGDADPRGMKVIAANGEIAGVVEDLWVDRGETIVRYLEVGLAGSSGRALLPMTMARIDKRRSHVKVEAITAAQFVNVPKLQNPNQITLYEEERVTAYYGGGLLYATPSRAEPLL